ncbi:PDZ and LIM domain protein 7 [Triplophysa tibetana]|uniref:PDZ and LIM domain protein 7 n=1 Tax=Triplophysa tibetana TaxID=1572043 RepID=A0A5A9NI12_9TELE|nr:PDZ and LIM domain protein 7 [Triplophysa tibetana]
MSPSAGQRGLWSWRDVELARVTEQEGRELSFASSEKVRLSRSARFPLGSLEVYVTTLARGKSGPAPWGFRLQGGKDFNMPLTVSRLIPGGKASQAGVGVGDWVVSICEANAEEMTHVEAQNKIRAATDALTLTLSRAFDPAGGEQKKTLTPVSSHTKYSFAPSTAINKMARPFSAVSGNGSTGPIIKPVSYAPKLNSSSQVPSSTPQPHNGGEAFYEELYREGKHGLRVDNMACFIPNDRSKKRLIQDTEDWQPRTGTTQSRSFRILAQLTGTDFSKTDLLRPQHDNAASALRKLLPLIRVQDPDDEIMKRSSHGVTSYPAKTKPADKPEGVQAPAKAQTSSGPSCRPPWVTDPGFADRYHPDKTSTVMTQHTQPVQPTPMQNRSSIMQAAQQNPGDTSGRTPLCAACNKIIRGRYVVALGRSWHPEEFTCCQCKRVLDEGGFFEEKGSIYCTKCYDNRYSPNCAKCKKKITGEIMHALKMTYHVQCFLCAACKMPIRNQAFYMEEGEPYCEKDYEKMFGTKCHGCDFKIDAGDRFLEALGYSWHDTCFVCAICNINLEGKTFFSKKDKPLCKSHAFTPV